jgi:hypothetical protein
MTTPEERARTIFNEIEEIEESSASPAIIGLIEDAIAAAIREARNEALQEAAGVATASLAYYPDDIVGEACARIACRSIAAAILALKDKP